MRGMVVISAEYFRSSWREQRADKPRKEVALLCTPGGNVEHVSRKRTNALVINEHVKEQILAGSFQALGVSDVMPQSKHPPHNLNLTWPMMR